MNIYLHSNRNVSHLWKEFINFNTTSDNLIGLHFSQVNSFTLAYECYYLSFNFARHWPLCCIFNSLPVSFFIKHFWSIVSFDVSLRKNFACLHIGELSYLETLYTSLNYKKGLTQLDWLLCYNTGIWGKHIKYHEGWKDIRIWTACSIILILSYCSSLFENHNAYFAENGILTCSFWIPGELKLDVLMWTYI